MGISMKMLDSLKKYFSSRFKKQLKKYCEEIKELLNEIDDKTLEKYFKSK